MPAFSCFATVSGAYLTLVTVRVLLARRPALPVTRSVAGMARLLNHEYSKLVSGRALLSVNVPQALALF
jgi:hypothetical protein